MGPLATRFTKAMTFMEGYTQKNGTMNAGLVSANLEVAGVTNEDAAILLSKVFHQTSDLTGDGKVDRADLVFHLCNTQGSKDNLLNHAEANKALNANLSPLEESASPSKSLSSKCKC